jgi:hypothetical protein
MKKIYVFSLLTLCAFSMNAQVWYFGNQAGLDFTNGTVVSVSNGQLINTGEGCTMAYDDKCNLLFYSDGVTVWDENNVIIRDWFTHNQVTGANGLSGDPSSTQSAIAVPRLGHPWGVADYDEFLIFTTDKGKYIDTLAPKYKGFCFSDVINCLSTPEAIILNYTLAPEKSTEKIAVTGIPGGGFWILVHDFNQSPDNGCNYYAYKLDASGGFNYQTPVITSVGTRITGALANTQGQMKFSPDGTRVAITIPADRIIEILDFDNSGSSPTGGMLTNPRRIQFPNNTSYKDCELYGLEFSPNSHYLFIGGDYNCITNPSTHRMYQVALDGLQFPDLETTDCGANIHARTFTSFTEIENTSGMEILNGDPDNNTYYGQFQLARDQNIYVAKWFANATHNNLVGCIEHPDDFPATFDPSAVTLNSPQYCQAGLPTLIQDQFVCNPPAPVSCDSCEDPLKYLHTGLTNLPGHNDPSWVEALSGNPAVIVTPPISFPLPMAGSQWISASYPPPSVANQYYYKYPFSVDSTPLCPDPSTFELVGSVLADNAIIYLKRLSSPSQTYTLGVNNSVTTPFSFSFNTNFTTGNYELIVEVNNPAGSLPVINVKAWVCCVKSAFPPCDTCLMPLSYPYVHTGLGGGQFDPRWTVTGVPPALGISTPVAANIIYTPPIALPSAVLYSKWISPTVAPTLCPGTYEYQGTFNLTLPVMLCPQNYVPLLRMCLQAYNAEVMLDGALMGMSSGTQISPVLLEKRITPASGSHTITVTLSNVPSNVYPMIDAMAWICCVDSLYGVENLQDAKPYRLYPNPAGNTLVLETRTLIEQVIVFNAVGQPVSGTSKVQDMATFDVSQLPEGIYFVTLQTRKGSFREKVVVKR